MQKNSCTKRTMRFALGVLGDVWGLVAFGDVAYVWSSGTKKSFNFQFRSICPKHCYGLCKQRSIPMMWWKSMASNRHLKIVLLRARRNLTRCSKTITRPNRVLVGLIRVKTQFGEAIAVATLQVFCVQPANYEMLVKSECRQGYFGI